jgi:hypothetical protein
MSVKKEAERLFDLTHDNYGRIESFVKYKKRYK